MSFRFFQFIVLLKSIVALLIFSMDDLSIVESGVLKYPPIIVLLPIPPFSSVNVCFKYLDAPMLGYVYIYNGYILLLNWFFYNYTVTVSLILRESVLSDISLAIPTVFHLLITWNITLYPFTFNLCMSLNLKWVFWR